MLKVKKDFNKIRKQTKKLAKKLSITEKIFLRIV